MRTARMSLLAMAAGAALYANQASAQEWLRWDATPLAEQRDPSKLPVSNPPAKQPRQAAPLEAPPLRSLANMQPQPVPESTRPQVASALVARAVARPARASLAPVPVLPEAPTIQGTRPHIAPPAISVAEQVARLSVEPHPAIQPPVDTTPNRPVVAPPAISEAERVARLTVEARPAIQLPANTTVLRPEVTRPDMREETPPERMAQQAASALSVEAAAFPIDVPVIKAPAAEAPVRLAKAAPKAQPVITIREEADIVSPPRVQPPVLQQPSAPLAQPRTSQAVALVDPARPGRAPANPAQVAKIEPPATPGLHTESGGMALVLAATDTSMQARARSDQDGCSGDCVTLRDLVETAASQDQSDPNDTRLQSQMKQMLLRQP